MHKYYCKYLFKSYFLYDGTSVTTYIYLNIQPSAYNISFLLVVIINPRWSTLAKLNKWVIINILPGDSISIDWKELRYENNAVRIYSWSPNQWHLYYWRLCCNINHYKTPQTPSVDNNFICMYSDNFMDSTEIIIILICFPGGYT